MSRLRFPLAGVSYASAGNRPRRVTVKVGGPTAHTCPRAKGAEEVPRSPFSVWPKKARYLYCKGPSSSKPLEKHARCRAIAKIRSW